MEQAAGIICILGGAILFHIASSNGNPANVSDVWRDILAVLEGKSIKTASA